MATKEEMDKFQADQRHILITSKDAGDATIAISRFNLDDREKKLCADVLGDPEKYKWINSMSRDMDGKFIWLHGKGEEGIKLTFLESDWMEHGGSPLNPVNRKTRLKP